MEIFEVHLVDSTFVAGSRSSEIDLYASGQFALSREGTLSDIHWSPN